MARREAERKHQAAITALRAALAEPVQEPVTLAWSNLEGTKFVGNGEKWKHKDCVVPLYTAPPQRKPLTDDQLDDIAVAARTGNLYDLRIAIERAHGIGGKDD